MAAPTAAALAKLLADHELLEPAQLDQVRRTPGADARALAAELVRRGWLTSYQAHELLQGNPPSLQIGPYVVLECLGKGAMGQVFKARHRVMSRVVALKVIHRERLSNPQAVARFTQEIRAVAQLAHPNIVTAYDCGQDGDSHFLAMEYVAGSDLARLVKERGPLPVAQACDYVRQAALGLQHAHEHGLVHRDVKLSNLMLTAAGQVKVLDFGLARFERGTKSGGHHTQVGRLIGTVDFMAPEQAEDARAAEACADQYSLGCCLFYLLTGRPPFLGADVIERLSARVLGDAPPLRSLRPDAPEELGGILSMSLARNSGARYPSCAAFASALAPFCGPAVQQVNGTIDQAPADRPVIEMPHARRRRRRNPYRGLLVASIVSLVVLAVVLVFVWRQWEGWARERPPAEPKRERDYR